jgi:hypothetical protein
MYHVYGQLCEGSLQRHVISEIPCVRLHYAFRTASYVFITSPFSRMLVLWDIVSVSFLILLEAIYLSLIY